MITWVRVLLNLFTTLTCFIARLIYDSGRFEYSVENFPILENIINVNRILFSTTNTLQITKVNKYLSTLIFRHGPSIEKPRHTGINFKNNISRDATHQAANMSNYSAPPPNRHRHSGWRHVLLVEVKIFGIRWRRPFIRIWKFHNKRLLETQFHLISR